MITAKNARKLSAKAATRGLYPAGSSYSHNDKSYYVESCKLPCSKYTVTLQFDPSKVMDKTKGL